MVLLDLDGVVWLAHRPIPGSVEAIARLRDAGVRVVFVTNNSAAKVGEQERALDAIGVPAVGDVVTSAMAAAQLVSPAEQVLVCGADGIVEALGRRGAEAVRADAPDAAERVARGDFDAVMVGFHRWFDYEGMRLAATAVRRGARLIGTNDDVTYPTPEGPIPGGGSILAAVEAAAGVRAVVAGKPYEAMAAMVRSLVGVEHSTGAVMVGDRPDTDGRFARRLECRYAHVWSGVTSPGAIVEPIPDLMADDLAGVVAHLLDPPVS